MRKNKKNEIAFLHFNKDWPYCKIFELWLFLAYFVRKVKNKKELRITVHASFSDIRRNMKKVSPIVTHKYWHRNQV